MAAIAANLVETGLAVFGSLAVESGRSFTKPGRGLERTPGWKAGCFWIATAANARSFT